MDFSNLCKKNGIPFFFVHVLVVVEIPLILFMDFISSQGNLFGTIDVMSNYH